MYKSLEGNNYTTHICADHGCQIFEFSNADARWVGRGVSDSFWNRIMCVQVYLYYYARLGAVTVRLEDGTQIRQFLNGQFEVHHQMLKHVGLQLIRGNGETSVVHGDDAHSELYVDISGRRFVEK